MECECKMETDLNEDEKMNLRIKIIGHAHKLLGIPYKYGAEWTDLTKIPESLDCTELIEGVYHLVGLKMPDGGMQFSFTVPTSNPKVGDLVFFGRGGKAIESQIYHAGLVFDETQIIEARGHQPESNFETGKVILRPRKNWEAYSNFVGYRSHPRLL